MSLVVGRLAPSPTGAQHLGNARTYLLAWLSVRARGGRVILRVEDIDSPRTKPGAADQALEDLRWLGLDWDEGPDRLGEVGPYVQTERTDHYRAMFDALRARDLVYPCTCSRSDIAAAASAPHAGHEGPVYPRTCYHRGAADARQLATPFAWRFRWHDTERTFIDGLRGREWCRPCYDLGDFVVFRSDQTPAYQLAVVADDHAMGVTEVVRGDDLVPSTFRQLALYEVMGWEPPRFTHVPLVVGRDGRRLAKRHGDTRLATLRESGVDPRTVVGYLAWTLGLLEAARPVWPAELLDSWCWSKVSREPLVWEPAIIRHWLPSSPSP